MSVLRVNDPSKLAAAVLLAGVLALVAPAAAQQDDEALSEDLGAKAGQVVRVFEIRYRQTSEVSILVSSLLSPDATLVVDSRTRTVTVRDAPDVVSQVADFIQQFDVPPRVGVVRIVLEKARRRAPDGGHEVFQDVEAWDYRTLADTTLEVLERGHVTRVVGSDDAFEIHVRLGSVDPERRMLHLDELSVARRMPVPHGMPASEPAPVREALSTSLDLEHGVGKVVMAARDERAQEALVVRVIGLVRDPGTTRR